MPGGPKGRKTEEAITALLSTNTIAEAAHEIGISVRTLQRWLKDSEFNQQYLEAKRDLIK